MILAISQRQQYNKYNAPIDMLEHNYLHYFKSFDILLLPIPNVTSQVQDYFNQFPIEGIILTGGEDINPKLYGENIEWPNISPLRDETEKRMLEIAVARRIPVLGICRGMQFINVFFGGKLVKNITEEITSSHEPGKEHSINLAEERIISKTGKTEMMVNSFHSQAVTTHTLSSSLKMFAIAQEHGIIEGIYHPSLPIAGIQWHPERDGADKELNRVLMEAFKENRLFWEK